MLFSLYDLKAHKVLQTLQRSGWMHRFWFMHGWYNLVQLYISLWLGAMADPATGAYLIIACQTEASPLINSARWYMWMLGLISRCPCCQTVAWLPLFPLNSVTTCLCLCASRDHYSSSAEPNGGLSASIAHDGKNIYVVESSFADIESQSDYIYFHFFRVKLSDTLFLIEARLSSF